MSNATLERPTKRPAADRIHGLDRLVTAVKEMTLRAASPSTIAPGGSNSRFVMPVLGQKCYAFASANQAGVNGAFNVLRMDSFKYDGTASWDITNYQYAVPVAGYYSMEARAGCSMPAVNGAYQTWFISIFVNGSEVTRGHGQSLLQPNPGSFAANLSSYVSSKLFLNTGDFVQFRGWPESGGAAPTIDGSAGGGTTYGMIHLLSI